MDGLIAITLLLVFLTHGNAQEQGPAQCEPQNVLLSNVSQELLVTWQDHASCTSLRHQVVYELLVLVEDKLVHKEEFSGTADDVGSNHLWTWMAFLPLECASHTVKIRSRSKNQTSPWTAQTLQGQDPSDEIQVFPQDGVFEVGSRATFCCIVPLGETFSGMSLDNYRKTSFNTSRINTHTYALTVDLLWPTLVSDADVKCATQTDEAGSCAIVGYPPSDRDLKCETRDFRSVQCLWTVGSQILSNPTRYWLLEQSCHGQGKCSQKVKVDFGERNWTLIARNALGTVELVDQADLSKRVHMHAPERTAVSVVYARNVTLSWTWTVQQYKLLDVTCQIQLNDTAASVKIEKGGVGLRSVVLNGLFPFWTYSAAVRCATKSNFWKWSEWSKAIPFRTKGDRPDALDVWTHKHNHQTLILWKFLEKHQSHGHIIDYEVTWTDLAKREVGENRIHVAHPNHSVALNLRSFQRYTVKVSARNKYGRSEPSQIVISSHPQDPAVTNTGRIKGVGGGFSLSWAAVATASCGYIVECCPVSGERSVEWLKVPSSNTSANIFSKSFKDGVRYILSVYVCTEDAPVLLEQREGYVKETRMPNNMFQNLRWQQHSSDVEISWDRISLKEQSAFITGYILYCAHESSVLQVTSGDPEATRLIVRKLNMTLYTFTVCAVTAEGECGSTTINASLSPQTDNLVSTIIITLVTVLILFLLITFVCYRHWACIKQSVYPPIPEPVLTGKWSAQDVASYCPEEERTMTVPELHALFPTSNDGYICQREKLITSTKSAYPNAPLEKHNPQSSSLTPTRLSVIPNPVYNLVILKNSGCLGLETDYQHFEKEDSNDCQAQLIEDLFFAHSDTDSIMSCVSAYIVLPNSSSNKD